MPGILRGIPPTVVAMTARVLSDNAVRIFA
jgi:hypothetical protein